MLPAQLVEAPPGGQHGDHAGVSGVDIREKQKRSGRGSSRMDGEVREGPYRVVEHGQVGPLGGERPGLRHRHLVGGDRHGPADHVVTGGLAHGHDASLHVVLEPDQALVDEVAAVTEGQDPNVRHGTNTYGPYQGSRPGTGTVYQGRPPGGLRAATRRIRASPLHRPGRCRPAPHRIVEYFHSHLFMS